MGGFRKFGKIQEEREFTNPHVRFRRIRGKIVPIFNKKRIGQDISDTGEALAVKGLTVAGATYLAKKTKLGKKITKPISKFKMKESFLNIKSGDGFKMKSFKKLSKFAGKSAKFGLKHSGKIGLASLGFGLATKLIGDEIQMRSPFGKDYAFIRDRQGRDT